MPVCPGRVNGFSLLFLEKPFTLPGYTGHRRNWCPYVILYRRLFQPGYTGHIHFIRDSIANIYGDSMTDSMFRIAEVYKRTNSINFYFLRTVN